MVGNDGGKKGVVGSEGGEGVVGRVGWGTEWWVGRDGGEISGQGGMGERAVGREGWGRE